ncbi:DNA translocase FtsK [Candidatus Peribacteria bacterium]|nr:DNA translocase FtsK [Candidatus Peribacteria bacterium]
MVKRRRKLRQPRKRKRLAPALDLEPSTRRHISGALQIAAGILLVLVLKGEAGLFGAALSKILTFFFGAYAGIFAGLLITSGLLHWLTVAEHFSVKRSAGLSLCLVAFLGVAHMTAPMEELAVHRDDLGGAIGFMASFPFVLFATPAVGFTVLGALFLVGIFVAFEPNISALVRLVSERKRSTRSAKLSASPRAKTSREVDESDDDQWVDEEEGKEETPEDLVEEDREPPELNIVRPSFVQSDMKSAKATPKPLKVKKAAKDTIEMTDKRYEEWTFPAFDLLDDKRSELTVDDEELKVQARRIEEKLREFKIDVTMRDAHPGPTVTQFTLEPSEGVKLSSIGTLKDDLALALAAESLRIEAPIPGKSLVGIEMPNRIRTTVHLREILESPEFTQSASPLTLPLGRDVSGKAVVAALEDMPHLLIAGATGSGKSVCMNTFLTALLFQNAPDQLKFILVDPKRVELMPFDGIPHLLTPVITESEKALQALRWAVAEMGRRLHRFSEVGAKNLAEFNEKQTEEGATLPRIIIVIDELADLMMRQYRRDTETMIARIAQMARATGMHLVIATQRPSVDVITGLIKANIPTRIAFRVVSAVDSRTIIDSIGADDLLGKGDMLYMTASTPKPVRIQGIFISTKETDRVINAVKIAGGGKVTEHIGLGDEEDEADDAGEEGADGVNLSPNDPAALLSQPYAQIDLEADDDGGDSMFFDAVAVVQETGKASASLLQRRLSVGYARAAKLLDIMEKKGLIGPVRGAKAREVFLDRTGTPA